MYQQLLEKKKKSLSDLFVSWKGLGKDDEKEIKDASKGPMGNYWYGLLNRLNPEFTSFYNGSLYNPYEHIPLNPYNYTPITEEDIPELLELKEEKKVENPLVVPTGKPKNPYTNFVRTKLINNSMPYTNFRNQFDLYLLLHPEDEDTRTILTSIAALESEYNPKITNDNSSALGYFLFLDGTRSRYNNQSRKDFGNDTLAQIATAVAHYRALQKELKPYQLLIEEEGLTPLLAMYGMWWRPKSMINFLKNGYDDYRDELGVTLLTIFKKAE